MRLLETLSIVAIIAAVLKLYGSDDASGQVSWFLVVCILVVWPMAS